MPVRRKVFRIEAMRAAPVPEAAAGEGERFAEMHAQMRAELARLRSLVERRRNGGMPAGDGERTEAELASGQRHPISARAGHSSETGSSGRAELASEASGQRGHSISARAGHSPETGSSGRAAGLRQLKDETDTIHRAISRTKEEIAALHASGLDGSESNRVFRELDAVVGSAERAIQQILAAAEDIDEAANTLSAALRLEGERSLAQDIRDHVVRIFEACNFQDLAGQRITKVMATFKFVETRVARMMDIWGGIDAFAAYTAVAADTRDRAPTLLNGPKLDGEQGHASQDEIDAIFKAS